MSLVLLATISLASPLAARGSKKPQQPAKPAAPRSLLRKLVAVDRVVPNNLMGNEADNARFAFLLGEQFSHHLVSSDGFVVTPVEASESQFDLDVTLIAFEVVSSKGTKFGFSPSKVFLPIGLEFSIQAQSLIATFRIAVRDPLTDRVVASVLATATLIDTKNFFQVRYSDFVNASFESTKKTPLSKVTGSALQAGLAKVETAPLDLEVGDRIQLQGDRTGPIAAPR